MFQALKNRFSCFVDFIFPPACCICGALPEEGDKYFCAKCKKDLTVNRISRSRGNEYLPDYQLLSPVLHLYLFNETVLELIHQIKYQGKKTLGRSIGKEMGRYFRQLSLDNIPEIIIPVPLHKKREQYRGYNQSERLAQGISDTTGIPVRNDILKREKNSKSQTRLNKEERLLNVKNIFTIDNRTGIAGKTVLLVDDIFTTGATLNECRKTLISANVYSVYPFTITAAPMKYE